MRGLNSKPLAWGQLRFQTVHSSLAPGQGVSMQTSDQMQVLLGLNEFDESTALSDF